MAGVVAVSASAWPATSLSGFTSAAVRVSMLTLRILVAGVVGCVRDSVEPAGFLDQLLCRADRVGAKEEHAVAAALAHHTDSSRRGVGKQHAVPPRPAGTAAIGAVVHLLVTAHREEGRDLFSMSGIRAGTAYRLLLA